MNTMLASCIVVCALVNPAEGFMVANGPHVTVGRARSVRQKKRFVGQAFSKLVDPWYNHCKCIRFMERLAWVVP